MSILAKQFVLARAHLTLGQIQSLVRNPLKNRPERVLARLRIGLRLSRFTWKHGRLRRHSLRFEKERSRWQRQSMWRHQYLHIEKRGRILQVVSRVLTIQHWRRVEQEAEHRKPWYKTSSKSNVFQISSVWMVLREIRY